MFPHRAAEAWAGNGTGVGSGISMSGSCMKGRENAMSIGAKEKS
jgi:hypothetical protein